MANTRPGNDERGWNDPPMFLYTPGTPAAVTTKRTPLNKRVGHCLNQTAPPDVGPAGPALTAPPMSSACGPPPVANTAPPGVSLPPTSDVLGPSPTTNTIIPNNVLFDTTSLDAALTNVKLVSPAATPILLIPSLPSSEQSSVPDNDLMTLTPLSSDHKEPQPKTHVGVSEVNAVMVSLQLESLKDDELFKICSNYLNVVVEACKTFLKDRTILDIKRRIEIFCKMWQDGKLSYSVKIAMTQLAQALVSRQCDVAFDLHLGLMMDHMTEVSQWMVGVKRLIQEARKIPLEYPMSEESPHQSDETCRTSDISPQQEDSQSTEHSKDMDLQGSCDTTTGSNTNMGNDKIAESSCNMDNDMPAESSSNMDNDQLVESSSNMDNDMSAESSGNMDNEKPAESSCDMDINAAESSGNMDNDNPAASRSNMDNDNPAESSGNMDNDNPAEFSGNMDNDNPAESSGNMDNEAS